MRNYRGDQKTRTRESGGLPRIAYLIITLGCLITAISLYASGYTGYSGLVAAIGVAAAINLKA